MGKLKQFFKTAAVFMLGNAFSKLLSFFLLPLYTSKIDPSDYGEYGFVLTVLNVGVPILFISIWDGVFRFTFDYDDKNKKYEVLSNGFFIMLLGSICAAAVTWIAWRVISFSNPFLIFGYALAMGFQYYYTVIARSFKRNTLFVISGCANSLTSILINLVLILKYTMGVEVLYVSYIVGVIIQIVIIESRINFLRHISFSKLKKGVFYSYSKFSVPVMISAVSNWLLNGLTQWYIIHKLGAYYNGLYNVANKFASILVLGVGVFQFAWNEMAYDLSRDPNKNPYYEKSIREMLRFALICASVLPLMIKLIYPFMIHEQYQESLIIIPILMTGTMANAYSGFLGTIFLADKKTKSLFVTTLLSGLMNVIGLCILIPLRGFVGAVSSLCFAFLFYAIIRLVLLKKNMSITISIKSILPIPLLICSIVSFYVFRSRWKILVVLVVIICISFVLLWDLIRSIYIFLKNRKARSKPSESNHCD